MKITIKPVEPVPPPKRVILDLSEEEAGMLCWFSGYFARRHLSPTPTPHAESAARLYKQLELFKNKEKYPFTDCFIEE